MLLLVNYCDTKKVKTIQDNHRGIEVLSCFFSLLIICLAKALTTVSLKVIDKTVFIGGNRPDQSVNKVSVIGGGDLGMAAVLSIMAKVNLYISNLYIWLIIFLSTKYQLMI